MCNVGIAVSFIMKLWLHHNCSGRNMSPFSEASAVFSDCVRVCSSFYIPWLAPCNHHISSGFPRIVIHIAWFSKSKETQRKYSLLDGKANRNAVFGLLGKSWLFCAESQRKYQLVLFNLLGRFLHLVCPVMLFLLQKPQFPCRRCFCHFLPECI